MDLDLVSGVEELKKSNKTSIILGFGFFSPLIFIIIVIIIPWQATFSIRANSGYVEINTSKQQKNWVIQDVLMSVDSKEPSSLNGILTLSKNINIKFQSLFEGGISVQINSNEKLDNNSIVATFENSETGYLEAFKGSIELLFSNGSNNLGYYLPLEGQWKVGNVVHSQSIIDNPILTSGTIQIFGDATFGDSRFKAMESELEPGDQIQLLQSDNKTVQGFGFINIKDNFEMLIQYHAEADYAEIQRFGSDGYSIGPSFWNRISNDPILNIVSSFISTWTPIILVLLLIYTRTQKVKSIKRNKKKKKR